MKRHYKRGSPDEVLGAFLRLGCISFGGPVAHLGYFRAEFVERRKWLDEATYGEIVGLCQFLPGPASSQTGFSIGLLRAGALGGLAAWLGFTSPSALLMLVFAQGVNWLSGWRAGGILKMLMCVAVAVVAQAVWNLGRRLCPDKRRLTLAIAAAALMLLTTWPYMQVLVIFLGALTGCCALRLQPLESRDELVSPIPKGVAVAALAAFFLLLAATFVTPVDFASSFYRAGALVFGGGHVVLPMLQEFVVRPRGLPDSMFLAGYGLAQALPGPLFTFAAYLGYVIAPEDFRWVGGLAGLAAIFLPGLLLIVGVFPFWATLRRSLWARNALAGVNAAVVGLLLAALYRPVWTSTIRDTFSAAVALLAFLFIETWKAPPWAVVLVAAALGAIL